MGRTVCDGNVLGFDARKISQFSVQRSQPDWLFKDRRRRPAPPIGWTHVGGLTAAEMAGGGDGDETGGGLPPDGLNERDPAGQVEQDAGPPGDRFGDVIVTTFCR